MNIETDGLEIGEVKGVLYRLVPLVKRGAERRQESKEFSSVGPVRVTFLGVMQDDGQIKVLKADTFPSKDGDGKSVELDGQALMTVSTDLVERIERRGGEDRRKL